MVYKKSKAAIKHLAKIKGIGLREAGKIKGAAEKFKKEVRKNMVTAITAAFGFMIALVWRDAITESVNKILSSIGLTNEAYLFRIFSAMIITVIAVIGVMFVSRWAEKKD